MKYIMLDIDGVCNNGSTRTRTSDGWLFINDELVTRIKKIIDVTGAQIVLTLTWREGWTSEPSMWNDISTVIRILTKHNYISVFRYDDCGYYWLRWTSVDNEEFGGPVVRFLDADEVDALKCYRDKQHNDKENDS